MNRSLDYDDVAHAYERRYRDYQYPGVARALLDFVGDPRDRRVLEVGCGTGHWLALLAERGARVSGVDLSRRMLERARGLDAVLVQGQAERLAWQDAAFERVVCVNALHHFTDKQAFFSESRRVLRVGGSLMTIGLDPDAGRDHWCIYDYFEGTLEADKHRYPTAQRIRDWMSAVGFSACRTLEVQHLIERRPAREALERGLLDKSATSQLGLLSDDAYGAGIGRIRQALERAEARGETLYLDSDLRLYATFGYVEAA